MKPAQLIARSQYNATAHTHLHNIEGEVVLVPAHKLLLTIYGMYGDIYNINSVYLPAAIDEAVLWVSLQVQVLHSVYKDLSVHIHKFTANCHMGVGVPLRHTVTLTSIL